MRSDVKHIKKQDLTAIILAGGKSSRMGTDKGMISYKGKPFISHIMKAVQPLVSETVIVSDNIIYDQFGVLRLEDEIKNHGPLAGLFTGLKASKTKWNLVLSCDIPLVSTPLLELLLNPKYNEYDIIQLKAGDRDMPLIARYSKNCLESCEKLIKSGEKRLMSLQQVQSHISIPVSSKLADQALNVNRISDLKIADYEG